MGALLLVAAGAGFLWYVSSQKKGVTSLGNTPAPKSAIPGKLLDTFVKNAPKLLPLAGGGAAVAAHGAVAATSGAAIPAAAGGAVHGTVVAASSGPLSAADAGVTGGGAALAPAAGLLGVGAILAANLWALFALNKNKHPFLNTVEFQRWQSGMAVANELQAAQIGQPLPQNVYTGKGDILENPMPLKGTE